MRASVSAATLQCPTLTGTPTDDPYTMEQLMSPRINIAIVRPLTIRLYNPDDISIGPSRVVACKSLMLQFTASW